MSLNLVLMALGQSQSTAIVIKILLTTVSNFT